jgi:hypothetical protein
MGVIELGLLNARPAAPISLTLPTDDRPTSSIQVFPTSTSPTPSRAAPSDTPQAGPTDVQPTQVSPTVSTTKTLPAEISTEMDQIQQQVIQLRELQAVSPVNRALITQDELKEKVKTDLLANYTQQDAQKDGLFYSSLGLLDPKMDFYTFYQDLLGEQVAGFYDDQAKEMYVIQGAGFNGVERFTYAHEYDHALQDQNYDLEQGLGLEDAKCKVEGDR